MSRSAASRRATVPSVSGVRSWGKAAMSEADRTLSPVPTAREDIEYAVRRSDRARRVRITVDPARGVEVVLPRRAPAREAAAAVSELRPWIERRLAELDR